MLAPSGLAWARIRFAADLGPFNVCERAPDQRGRRERGSFIAARRRIANRGRPLPTSSVGSPVIVRFRSVSLPRQATAMPGNRQQRQSPWRTCGHATPSQCGCEAPGYARRTTGLHCGRPAPGLTRVPSPGRRVAPALAERLAMAASPRNRLVGGSHKTRSRGVVAVNVFGNLQPVVSKCPSDLAGCARSCVLDRWGLIGRPNDRPATHASTRSKNNAIAPFTFTESRRHPPDCTRPHPCLT